MRQLRVLVILLICCVVLRESPEKDKAYMQASETCYKMIRESEGLKLNCYNDCGNLSIGYGHHANDVYPRMVISEVRAEELLHLDVAKCEQQLNSLNLTLNQNQFDALIDFIYNLGIGEFEGSTLLKKLKAEEYLAVPHELARWIYAESRVDPGLVARRARESALFVQQLDK